MKQKVCGFLSPSTDVGKSVSKLDADGYCFES